MRSFHSHAKCRAAANTAKAGITYTKRSRLAGGANDSGAHLPDPWPVSDLAWSSACQRAGDSHATTASGRGTNGNTIQASNIAKRRFETNGSELLEGNA